MVLVARIIPQEYHMSITQAMKAENNLGGYKKDNPDTGDDEIAKQKNALFVIISDTDSSFSFSAALL